MKFYLTKMADKNTKYKEGEKEGKK